MEITKEEADRLKESLGGITDWRRQSGHLLHKLIDALVIGLTTVVAGWGEYSVMEDFGKAKQDFFKTFLELPNGIPDEKTFSRLFARINPTELAACLGQWLEEVREAGGREINIDGKTICGSGSKGKGKRAAHIVSAWVGAQNLVLGQVATAEKSNEITAIPELLDTLEVGGDTITIDAMGCQREIAENIREKGADYVLAVKENQGETYREVTEYFEYIREGWEKEPPYDVWRSELEKGHGRIERREVLTEEELDWMGSKGKWKDLKTIIEYRCTRTEGEKRTEDSHYYLSSRLMDAEEAGRLIRGHWSIENRLHWFLDVCFGEDDCRARTNHAAENLNVLRKTALYLLQKTSVPEKRFSLSRKMLRATLSDDFLHDVLFGKVKWRCPVFSAACRTTPLPAFSHTIRQAKRSIKLLLPGAALCRGRSPPAIRFPRGGRFYALVCIFFSSLPDKTRTEPRSIMLMGSTSSRLANWGFLIFSTKSSIAFLPLREISCLTVVRPGQTYREICRSSKPIIDRSWGTRSPAS
jgi:predicted transposase YbfD/YdcC